MLKTYHVMDDVSKSRPSSPRSSLARVAREIGGNRSVAKTFRVIEYLSNDEIMKEKQKQLFKYIIADDLKMARDMLNNDPRVLAVRDDLGQTCLHIAVKKQKKEMLRLLLEANNQLLSMIDINHDPDDKKSNILPFTTVNIQDIRGRTPLYIASELDNASLIKMLIKNNANVFLCCKRGIFPVDVVRSEYAKGILDKAKIVSYFCSNTC